MEDWVAGHPWNGTPRQFFKLVSDRYGFDLHHMTATDPYGRRADIYYLQNRDKSNTTQLPGIDLDGQLDELVLGSLCRRLGIPPEDFGLQPEEPADEGEVLDLD